MAETTETVPDESPPSS